MLIRHICVDLIGGNPSALCTNDVKSCTKRSTLSVRSVSSEALQCPAQEETDADTKHEFYC